MSSEPSLISCPPPAELQQWLASPAGRYVMQWEAERFDTMVADLFGYHAVQVGMTQFNFLRNNRMTARTLCESTKAGAAAQVVACAEALPFESGSLDLVLLPHALEFSDHPHEVLREVERVLMPEGHVIVAGFNPLSLWGARRGLQRHSRHFPWHGQYLSGRRLKDWLQLLGFEARPGTFGCYAPPFNQKQWLERFRFMDTLGQRWWSVCGGVYLLQAVKRVHGMRLIQPNWRNKRTRAKALAPAAQRGQRAAKSYRTRDE